MRAPKQPAPASDDLQPDPDPEDSPLHRVRRVVVEDDGTILAELRDRPRPQTPPPPPDEELPSLHELAYEAEQQAARVRSIASLATEAMSDSLRDHDVKMCFAVIDSMMELVCDNLSQIVWELPSERADRQAEEDRP